MNSDTQIVELQLSDGTTVKVEAAKLGGYEDVADIKQLLSFKSVTDAIEGISREVLEAFKKIGPNKATVEFGVEVAIESGQLSALLVKGSGTGNLKVSFEWSQENTSKK